MVQWVWACSWISLSKDESHILDKCYSKIDLITSNGYYDLYFLCPLIFAGYEFLVLGFNSLYLGKP